MEDMEGRVVQKMEHQLEQVKAELVAEKEAREALEVRYFFFSPLLAPF